MVYLDEWPAFQQAAQSMFLAAPDDVRNICISN